MGNRSSRRNNRRWLTTTNFTLKSRGCTWCRCPKSATVDLCYLVFHDRKRRINYYKVKRVLHQQQGNSGPIEITPEETSESSQSSEPSHPNFQMSKFLRSKLLRSFQKVSLVKSVLKDTLQEIHCYLQNQSYINLKEIDQ